MPVPAFLENLAQTVLGGSALAGVDSLFTGKSNRDSIRGSKELMRYQTSLADRQQTRSYGNMVRGMLGAGLSPAFNDANPSAAVTPSASFDSKKVEAGERMVNSFQLAGLSEELKNKRLVNQRQRLDNELAAFELRNKKAEQEEFNSGSYFIDDDGSIVYDPEPAQIEAFVAKHGVKPTILNDSDYTAKTRYEARNRKAELDTAMDEYTARKARALADASKADFDRHVTYLMSKMPDDAVAKSLAKMPQNQLAEIQQDLKLKGLQATYQELVNERYKSTSVTALVDMFKNPDIPWYDKLLSGLVMILQKFVDR